jgi:hypothetical protein
MRSRYSKTLTPTVQFLVHNHSAVSKQRVRVRLILYQEIRQQNVVPVHAMEACEGSRCTAPLILDFGTRWR